MITYQVGLDTNEHYEPTSVEEALSCNDNDNWERAMREELDSLKKNSAWTLVKLSEGETAIDNKWDFKIKKDLNGKVSRFKARLIVRGFIIYTEFYYNTQKADIDFDETSLPVIKHSTLKLLIALAAELNFSIHHMDVKTAFLNGE